MSVSPGTRLGPYEVTGQIGAGGMGEVCRARDTKLNRDVALKVLPTAFATDPERMTRLQREAQLLAALNHPNIAAIYGLEDESSVLAIVMELVEGHTLTGPLPIGEALPLAKQIAEALEYAHDRGIIHRDLKPANIKVTPDGSVKVLDFGLAKAMDDAGDSTLNLRGSMSPTLSLAATHAGVIMGTAGYMAPEQAKGKGADRRSDVWSFGIVLYELLTGSRMFDGDTVPETLASVMKDQVTLEKLPEDTPAAIRKLLARCLERDPRRRLQSIGEARIVIEDVTAGTTPDERTAQTQPTAAPISKWPWAVAAVAVLAAIGVGGWMWTRPAPAAPNVTRFQMLPPDGVTLTSASPNATQMAVSPDGRFVAFVADEQGRPRTLWVRALDSLVPQRLERTEGADMPFWSPDSRNIAYFADGKLMRIAIAGGSPLKIADANDPEGGSWFQRDGEDGGDILFAPDGMGPIQRVVAQGGVPVPVTKLAEGESAHSFPQFLPDGRRFLYLSEGKTPGIYVHSLDTGERTHIVDNGGRAMFSPPNILLYLRDGTLLAHRWNLATLKLEGEPVSIAEEVRSGGGNGRNGFAVSANGVLAYRSGGAGGNVQVTWYSRDGKAQSVAVETQQNLQLELSPDNRYLVVGRGEGADRDLWLKDLTSGVFSRLTSASGREGDPVWSSDSRRIAYVGEPSGDNLALFETTIGSGTHTRIPGADGQNVEDWLDDGTAFLLRRNRTLRLLPVGQSATTATPDALQTVVEFPFAIDQFRVSPDGKWVAYTSGETERSEINVARFPEFTDRRQISSGGSESRGAVQPLWRADGRELFFLGNDRKIYAVDVKADATLETGPVRALFQTAVAPSSTVWFYAVTRDGQRFLIREPTGSDIGSIEPLHIVTNWTSLVAQ